MRAADATLLFLPHDVPERNPIEPLFSTLKHRLRHTAEPSPDTVSGVFAQSLDITSAVACANDDASAGYDRT
jgi:hypothetical protein